MLIETVSTPLVLALAGPAADQAFGVGGASAPWVRAAEPTGPGVVAAGVGSAGEGGTAANRLLLVPVSVGVPAAFSLRVVGWWDYAAAGRRRVWVGVVVAEFACQGGAIPGPAAAVAGTEPVRVLGPADYLCDGLALTGGSVGAGRNAGQVVQFGAGSGVPAFAVLDLLGARKVQFDFRAGSGGGAANCLWARC